MGINILIAAVTAVLVAAAIPALASAAPSSAPTKTPAFSGKLPAATRYCHNYKGGTVGFGATNTGYLYAGTNRFVCQQRAGENPSVGSARNNIWLYTQGDVSYSPTYHGWGWFPATYVSGGVNYGPIPGLHWC
jgi:hypothetical protein